MATIVGTLSRSVPLGVLAKAVHHVERALDLAQRRRQPLQEPLARLGRSDAAGRAIEQAHAERGLQPPQRLAQRRRRCAAHRGRAAEAARAGDRDEGVEIGKAGAGHCAPFRTGRANKAGL